MSSWQKGLFWKWYPNSSLYERVAEEDGHLKNHLWEKFA